MIRKIIRIDQEKCSGCGACAAACHEGAIEMVNGKAVLAREDYCDGLGDCLPACPTDAISFEEREAPAYDEAAVLAAKRMKDAAPLPCGCPGTQARAIKRDNSSMDAPAAGSTNGLNANSSSASGAGFSAGSQLRQWPVQIKLVPVHAPYFDNANLLVAADCTAYAYAGFHQAFMRGRVTLIGCPKLDGVDHSEKLAAILRASDVKSVTVLRMEVPCCGGLEQAVKKALQASGKCIPWQVVTLSVDGRVLETL